MTEETDLVPMGDFAKADLDMGIDLDNLMIQTQVKLCRHCDAERVKQVLKW